METTQISAASDNEGVYSAEYREQLQLKEGQQPPHLGTPTPFTQIQQQHQHQRSVTPEKHSVHYEDDKKINGEEPQPQQSPQLYTPPTPPAPYTPSSLHSPSPPVVPPHYSLGNEAPHPQLTNGGDDKENEAQEDGGESLSSPPLPLSPSHGPGEDLTGARGSGGRRKQPVDKDYFIAKELLTTERTYAKDLLVINGHLRLAWEGEPELGELCSAVPQLLQLTAPIVEAHTAFLAALENRLANWDGRSGSGRPDASAQRIVDLVKAQLEHLPLYEEYLQQLQGVLEGLQGAIKRSRRFELFYREFEAEKICYLPFTAFVLKPIYRLHHYLTILESMSHHYGSTGHPDVRETLAVKTKLSLTVTAAQSRLMAAAQYVKLVEVERDLVGLENLVQPGRAFIREGCLQKLSRKGYQQRMFFLFNDVLLYTNRTGAPGLQFKVHGQLPLRGVMVEETESRMGAAHCFTIYGGNRALMVAANNAQEKQRWLNDLTSAIAQSKTRPDQAMSYLSLKSISASDEVLDHSSNSPAAGGAGEDPAGRKTPGLQPSNSSVHVCWHRATSVHYSDYVSAAQNQLSGYLLRKFKNSMGWQKLWVVFTNFCLFFYKTFQDDAPLASLPLLGYTVSSPAPHDMVNKEHVFKLQFKNHVYFFRAESEYTFSRWLEVIGGATQASVCGKSASPTAGQQTVQL